MTVRDERARLPADAVAETIDRGSPRPLENDPHGVGVGCFDALHHVVRIADADVVVRIAQRREREGDISRGHRNAVVPARVVYEMVRNRPSIRRDVAVRKGRHAFGQIGHLIAALIVSREPVEEKLRNIRFDGQRPDDRIQRARLLGQRNAQFRR